MDISESVYRQFATFCKTAMVLILLLVTIMPLVSCAKIEPEGNQDYLIKIKDEIISEEEASVYIYQVITEFERVGGTSVWDYEDFSGGKSAKEVAKERVLENMIRMKIMINKAQELGILLSEEDLVDVEEASLLYFDNMDENYIQDHQLTYEMVESVIKDYTYALKVFDYITKDFVPLEENIERQLMENVEYLRFSTLSPGQLLSTYTFMIASDDSQEEVTYMVKDMPEEFFEKYLQGISVGQTIKLLGDTETSYELVEIIPADGNDINDYVNEMTGRVEQLRSDVIDQLERSAFDEIYESWKLDYTVEINKEIWNQLEIDPMR